MFNHDITLVDPCIRRVLSEVVERLAVVVFDPLTALVVVREDGPEGVADCAS